MKNFINFITYLIVLAIVKLIVLFPRTVMLKIADLLGDLAYSIDSHHRNVALTNIGIAFPGMEVKKAHEIAKNSFRNMFRTGIEVMYAPKIISSENIANIMRLEGEKNILDGAKKKKGVLCIAAHFGVWEFLFYGNYLLPQPFVPLNAIIRPSDNPYIDKFINHARELLGTVMVPKKQSIKPIIKALQRNESIGILIDQNVCREEGVFVDFFGKKAATTFGATLLALRTDAPIVPVFVYTDRKTNTHVIKFLPEIPLTRTGNSTEDIRINTQKFTACVEDIIRKNPEQWLWVHKRWKTRPIGEEEKIY
ncbi:MAG: lysophospholipid acyltransferase family protein [Candidatus Ancaeobacter aquaticus]|nr:lysophospholipid acyltransferase family protein [Candidatus Ancaeobacter aquaticus]